jgi:RHS repeat-associated protein
LQEDEKHQFEYDVNGNMVRKTVKASGVTWRYGYTVYDELASASRHASADPVSPALEKAAYVFDAFGRRIAERRFDAANALTGGTNYHYDGEEVSHETDLNASGAVTVQRWTTHSDGVDDLLAVTLQAGAGQSSPTAFLSGPAAPSNVSYYCHTDHQGSVRAITDQSGAVTNAYAYDSYGTAQESVESLAQRFRYTGREYDALTGLYHYRARAYDPDTARFLQEDPLWFEAGDLNVYRMTWNNPVNWTDPSGMAGEATATTATDRATLIGSIAVGAAIACQFNYLAQSTILAFNDYSNINRAGLCSAMGNPPLPTIAAPPGSGNGGSGGAGTGGTGNGGSGSAGAGGTGAGTSSAAPVAGAGTGGKGATGSPPPPNNGDCRPHGGGDHWQLILNLVASLQNHGGVTDIRANQWQVDISGNVVGRNRPDVQWTQDGVRHHREFDRGSTNQRHQDDINRNDPNCDSRSEPF